VPSGRHDDVANHERRRLASNTDDRSPAKTELAFRLNGKSGDGVTYLLAARAHDNVAFEQHSQRRRVAGLTDERGEAVPERLSEDRAVLEQVPVPDVHGTQLAVRRRQRRAAFWPEQER